MTFKLDIEFKKFVLFEDKIEELFEHFETSINIINNQKSFFINFSPVTKSSELAKYIQSGEWEGNIFTYEHKHANYPLFGMLFQMNHDLKDIIPTEEVCLTHDAYQTELVFKRFEDEIHVFYHHKQNDLWYDGYKIVYSTHIPGKSCFIVNRSELKQAIELFNVQFQDYLGKNQPEIMKHPLVLRSFGMDQAFNDFNKDHKKKLKNRKASETKEIQKQIDLLENREMDDETKRKTNCCSRRLINKLKFPYTTNACIS
ncbi:hypothetical protein COJ46_03185 [Bacillus sp. AFS077874]|uniref:hypothetical protein n=1 Tax=unclassified Bacillus (in: firmicutes) TaxID=185979 RepID=UPI000BED8860|nr:MULTISPECIES: hypothetical protein [unclassified Bacillus (in: firmicutes)]PEC48807.1 hypothetical protein CON00_14610 [Bacillus sp. AFS096315]PFM82827.1 hypothetical protein COJ46_03185 [Bacillus sp. AFS077874]